MVRYTAKDNTE